MIPVMQTETGARGNCFSACLASIFELPIEDVPNFFDLAGDDESNYAWWRGVRDWLRPRGFGVIWLALNSADHLKEFDGWMIVSGKSCRGVDHATVWRLGELIHDPHPSGCGLVTVEGVDMLYPLNPAVMRLAE